MLSTPHDPSSETNKNDLKAACKNCCLKIAADIKCLKCKIVFQRTNIVTDFFINVEGKRSVKEAIATFFEDEFIEKYDCIWCMTSTLASKKWKLHSTPEGLSLVLTNNTSQHQTNNFDIEIDRYLILKCSAMSKIRYWKYDLATVIDHAGQSYGIDSYFTTAYNGKTMHMLDNSRVQKDYELLHGGPFKLFYERIEEVLIDAPIEYFPIIIIDSTDSEISSDGEIPTTSIIEVKSQNCEVKVISDQYLKEVTKGKTEITKPKIREKSKRVIKRNRQFMDSTVWDTSDSSKLPLSNIQPPSCHSTGMDIKDNTDVSKQANVQRAISKTSEKTTKTSRKTKSETVVSMEANDLSENAQPNPPIQEISEKSTTTHRKTKNFVRLRFQIDCRAAPEVNVDELINFFKANIKVEGSKNNLTGIAINRHNSDINIMSKVLLKKKYLKQLAKKYLKKKKQSLYHVIEKNKRAYKILLK